MQIGELQGQAVVVCTGRDQGLTIPIYLTGTTACSTRDCRQAAAIVNSGRIDLSPLISARFPLDAALQAFAEAENRHSLKVVIEP